MRASRLVPLLAAGALALAPAAARASDPFLVTPDPAEAEQTPAYRYANMTDAEAFAELDRRGALYTKLGEVSGVRAPIRLTGRLHGVWFHSILPPERRVTSVFEILDARLALALDDFAAILERHDVDEVIHFTMYRPNAPAPDHDGSVEAPPAHRAAKGPRQPSKPTAKGRRPKTAVATGKSARRAPPPKPARTQIYAPPGTRHPAGLAIDVGAFHKKGGRWISVGVSFHGHIGDKTCGDGAPEAQDADARELRAIVCEADDAGVFTYVLTPNYNAAHSDHFHMEIKPGVKWFLYH